MSACKALTEFLLYHKFSSVKNIINYKIYLGNRYVVVDCWVDLNDAHPSKCECFYVDSLNNRKDVVMVDGLSYGGNSLARRYHLYTHDVKPVLPLLDCASCKHCDYSIASVYGACHKRPKLFKAGIGVCDTYNAK